MNGDSTMRAAGYEALVRRFNLAVIPNWHRSYVAAGGSRRVHLHAGIVEETYPPSYWPGETLGDQLEFALKYDGTNVAILANLFHVAPQAELVEYIQSRQTGKYARRLWFWYEFLTGEPLPLADLKQGNYVDLLEPELYYTVQSATQIRRQRVNDNLLGNRDFCPMIRRTQVLEQFENLNLAERCRSVLAQYPPPLLQRALAYLYTKETKSSFAIEHIEPSSTRTERFVALLQLAETEDFCEKNALIGLQNRIVDQRFQSPDYRQNQNYVGQSVAWQREKIYFAGPKPEDLEALMRGFVATHQRLANGNVSPVVHAAATGYGFVFLHPFEDGNGRIHRFLIHHVLARRAFTPQGVMFPISAAMLANFGQYDASLEAFSRPLMSLVEYQLDEHGHMTVINDTARWYAYIDLTSQAEALFGFIRHTIDHELVEELSFLSKYDDAKAAIQAIVDMPDRQIDLMIRFCLQNNGRLSNSKREIHFECLTDDEVTRIEDALAKIYSTS